MPGSADLGPRLEDYVTSLVRAGRYRSRSEVLGEGVRVVEEREKRLAALDAALARGLADVEAGRAAPIDDVATRPAGRYAGQTWSGTPAVVVLAAEAEADLGRIGDRIARDDPRCGPPSWPRSSNGAAAWRSHPTATRWCPATNATACADARTAPA